MLIVLDDSLLDFDVSNDIFCISMENILCKRFEGEHVVKCSPDVIRHLEKGKEYLSSRSVGVIKNLKKSHSFSDNQNINAYVNVVSYGSSITKNNNSWGVPLKFFYDSIFFSVVILGENLMDAKLAIKAGETYKTINGYKGMCIRAQPIDGGGSTLSDISQHYDHQVCSWGLAIADSDRVAPSSSMKDTAKTLLRKKFYNELIEKHILNAREMENILPKAVLSEIAADKNSDCFIDRADFYTELRQRWPILANYVDLKEGSLVSDFISYLNDVGGELNELISEGKLSTNCTNIYECEGRCDCELIGGFGSSILENAHTKMSYRSIPKISEIISSEYDMDWLSLGQKVFNLAVGTNKIRV